MGQSSAAGAFVFLGMGGGLATFGELPVVAQGTSICADQFSESVLSGCP